MSKYTLPTMTPENINRVIDQEIMGYKKGKTCHGILTIYVEIRNTENMPVSQRCEECGGKWKHETGQRYQVGFENGHSRVAPNYFGDMQRAMKVLAQVATQGKTLQEAVDFHLFQVVYNGRGMPELKTGLSVVQRVVAMTAEKICFACIHALNSLDAMESKALERMRGRNGS